MKKIGLSKITLFAVLLISGNLLRGQQFAKGDLFFSLGVGNGGFDPGTIYIENTANGENLVSPTNYKWKQKPIALSFNGQYALSELISLGAYVSPTFSRAEVSGVFNNSNNISGNFDNDGNNDDRFTKTAFEVRKRRAIFYGIKGEVHLAHLMKLPDEIDIYSGLSFGSYFQWERVNKRKETSLTTFNAGQPTETVSETIKETSSYTWRPDGGYTANLVLGGRYFFNENMGAGLEFGIPAKYAQLSFVYKL